MFWAAAGVGAWVPTAEKNADKSAEKNISFFPSIADIQFTTLKHRKDLIFIEAFKNKGGGILPLEIQSFRQATLEVSTQNGKRVNQKICGVCPRLQKGSLPHRL